MANSKLDKLTLTEEELTKFGKAFHDETFRDLFRQYLNELNDPINRKTFEEEITQLEKQNGHEIVFVKPIADYAIKTSTNGKIKTYVNFCSSETISKYSTTKAQQNHIPGINLSIPYSLSPAKQQISCHYYTVVFHPDTLKYAKENTSVKKLVHDTAFTAIERTYNVSLDKVNFILSKKPFKGVLESTILRRNHIIAHENTTVIEYVEPTYSIKYRDEVDLQNCTTGVYSKMNSLIPKYIITEINLPLLKTIKNTTLEIKPSTLYLQNDDPKYKLTISLSYEVDETQSSAIFNSDTHILKLELPVKQKSSVRVDEGQSPITEISDKLSLISLPENNLQEDLFFDSNIKYKLPEYFCNYHQNKIAFVLKVKNVNFNSFKYHIQDDRKGCSIKFSTLGSGHFPMYYSFCVLFTDNKLRTIEPLHYVVENENVFLYLHLQDNTAPLEYFVGCDPDSLKKMYLNEPEAVPLEFIDNKEDLLDVSLQVTKFTPEELEININAIRAFSAEISSSKPSDFTSPKDSKKMQRQFLDDINFLQFCTKPNSNDKNNLTDSDTTFPSHAFNKPIENRSWIIENKSTKKPHKKKRSEKKRECWSDTESKAEKDNVFEGTQPINIKSAYKYADMSGRSILKKSRSFSESSGDELPHFEYNRSLSIDDINFSSDSCSHSAPKKTVTFNDVIFKKLYSSDISIFEQRKRTKRRSQRKERRASESDNSETETTSKTRQENIRFLNENLFFENSETELTSVSESGETSDDQSDTSEQTAKSLYVPCSKKNHKRRGKKSARKNASTAKHQVHGDY